MVVVPVANIQDKVVRSLQPFTGAIVARSIAQVATNQHGVDLDHAAPDQVVKIIASMEYGLRAFLADRVKADDAVSALHAAAQEFLSGHSVDTADEGEPLAECANQSVGVFRPPPTSDATRRIIINAEYDIVTARSECRTMCADIGFGVLDQVKISTIVSELARNIVQYAESGHLDLTPVSDPRPGIELFASDNGKGIPDLEHIMSGQYDSKTGMGMGLIGTKRLMDDFGVETGPGGTRVTARKYVP